MRTIILVFLLFLCSPALAENIKWKNNLNDGMLESQKTGLPVFIYFTMDGCGYCNMMEQNVFPNVTIIEELKKFIPVKLKHGDNPVSLSWPFKVSVFPSYSVVRGGRIISVKNGYQSVSQLRSYLQGNNFPLK